MLEELKRQVYEANMELTRRGLVTYTWGNVSGIDRQSGLVVIKPSGVEYSSLSPEDMVVVNLDGAVVSGRYKPSSDTPTHLVLYKAFESLGAVAHTHSPYATAWAQAGSGIPCLGTTHADHFNGDVPCTRPMTAEEIEGDYEANTGRVIVQAFDGTDPMEVPAVLVASHGPFTFGHTPDQAVVNSVVLEEVSRMALATITIRPEIGPISPHLLNRHFYRKHGKTAYYGQR